MNQVRAQEGSHLDQTGSHLFGLGFDELSRLPDWCHARWSAHTCALTQTHALTGTLCAIMSWRRLAADGGWRLPAKA